MGTTLVAATWGRLHDALTARGRENARVAAVEAGRRRVERHEVVLYLEAHAARRAG